MTSKQTLDIVVSFHEDLINQQNFADTENYYHIDKIYQILSKTLTYLDNHTEIIIPNLQRDWLKKSLELDIYVTKPVEARAINLEARGKDYATNILSYPSDLPSNIAEMIPSLPLGELIICHDVVAKQADEQQKTVEQHLTHLLVHGVLHLLGFDHELGQAEQDEMESIEIAVLNTLGVANPYE